MKQSNHKTQITVAVITGLFLLTTTAISIYFSKKNNDNGREEIRHNNFYLTGTIVDEMNNNSISQATISVVGQNIQDYSQENGNFSLSFKDSIAQIRIRVIKSGYQTFDKMYNVPENVIIPLKKK